MNARDTALSILSTHGYLSKNILSRTLKITTSEAGKILEDISDFSGYRIYSRCFNNRVEISNSKLEGSKIYALSSHLDKDLIYKKEHELRTQFYETEEIVYPPAKSGVYQGLREISKGSAFLHSSTVKAQSKPNDDRVLVVKNIIEKDKQLETTSKNPIKEVDDTYKKMDEDLKVPENTKNEGLSKSLNDENGEKKVTGKSTGPRKVDNGVDK